jgi:hypothetical protein
VPRRPTIPDDPLDQLVPAEEAQARAAVPPPERPSRSPATGRHKLTTYLTAEQYRWALQTSSAAKQQGYPLSIADVVRSAVDYLRAAPEDEVRRVLGLGDSEP